MFICEMGEIYFCPEIGCWIVFVNGTGECSDYNNYGGCSRPARDYTLKLTNDLSLANEKVLTFDI